MPKPLIPQVNTHLGEQVQDLGSESGYTTEVVSSMIATSDGLIVSRLEGGPGYTDGEPTDAGPVILKARVRF